MFSVYLLLIWMVLRMLCSVSGVVCVSCWVSVCMCVFNVLVVIILLMILNCSVCVVVIGVLSRYSFSVVVWLYRCSRCWVLLKLGISLRLIFGWLILVVLVVMCRW